MTFNPEKVMTKRLRNPKIPKKNGSKTVSEKTDQKKRKKSKIKKSVGTKHFTVFDDFPKNGQKWPKMAKMAKNVNFRGVIFYYKTLCFYKIFSD